MKTSDFDFELPEELIAQTPLERRDASRLLTLDKYTGETGHHHFYELPRFLRPGDCLVLNDSRVLPARLIGRRSTGGACEVLLLIDKGEGLWECLVRPGRKMKPGAQLSFGEGKLTATVEAELPGGNRLVRFHYQGIFLEILEELGRMPLPPYIKAELQDNERYQTVYSKVLGSAAAPTAGLHFTPELLRQVEEMGVRLCYVTLHVGLGTFRPVKEEEITDHVHQGISEVGIVYVAQKQVPTFQHILLHKKLEFIPQSEKSICVYVGPQHPLYHADSVDFSDLPNLKFMRGVRDFFSMEHHLETVSMGVIDQSVMKHVIYSDSDHSIINFLLHTDVCSLGLNFMHRPYEQYDIKPLAINGCEPFLQIGYVRDPERPLSPQASWLTERFGEML